MVVDLVSAVAVFMVQGCRRRVPPSIGISPGSDPDLAPIGIRAYPGCAQGRPAPRQSCRRPEPSPATVAAGEGWKITPEDGNPAEQFGEQEVTALVRGNWRSTTSETGKQRHLG